MSLPEEVYRIYLSELFPNQVGGPGIPAGWYGNVPGVTTNKYIYCRVPEREDAWCFSRSEALRIVLDMHNRGYGAKCDPVLKVEL